MDTWSKEQVDVSRLWNTSVIVYSDDDPDHEDSRKCQIQQDLQSRRDEAPTAYQHDGVGAGQRAREVHPR
jgi:hypothetical protein